MGYIAKIEMVGMIFILAGMNVLAGRRASQNDWHRQILKQTCIKNLSTFKSSKNTRYGNMDKVMLFLR